MKPSTVCELFGFLVLSLAAFLWHPLAGLVVAGAFLLLIGYSFDDATGMASIQRTLAPFRFRRARRKLARENRRDRRKETKRRLIPRREPAEVVVRVESR